MDTNSDGNVDTNDESDFLRVTTGNVIVYAFLRPYTDSNGLTVTNFANSTQSVTLDLTVTNLKFTGGFETGNTYWVNNLYNGTSSQRTGSELSSLIVNLPPYGSAVYTISTEEEMVLLPDLPPIVSVDDEENSAPDNYILKQNYPNPFNPSTIIEYSIPGNASLQTGSQQNVSLVIYDILGREIAVLVNETQSPGNYRAEFNASNLSSGIYFYRLSAGTFTRVKKMMLVR
jgi:hypothetical protein